MRQWEYKLETVATAVGLRTMGSMNANGREGWELIAVTTDTPTTNGDSITLWWKRELQPDSPYRS